MIITRVILQDYGVYRGKNEFDFTCTEQKPIVLIGGTNGAGKTTLFESVMLCLYGISAIGKRSTKKSYEKFLAQKIHRYLKDSTLADNASITVQFKFFHNGNITEYQVERSWMKEEGSIHEQLDVKKRDSDKDVFGPLETIEKSQWQSFIADLIPKGIVNLFFFDGEKIVKMAKEGTEDITIKESLKSLLGIDVVEQLHTDLQVNLTRNLTGGIHALKQDFEKYNAEKEESKQIVGRLRMKLAQKQTEMDSLKMEIDGVEARISKIGGKFASKRDEYKNSLAAKKTAYDGIRQRIAELCYGVLPFAIIPKELDKLAAQIQTDESIQQQILGKKLSDSKLKNIHYKINDKKFWRDSGLDAKDVDRATSLISSLLKKETKQSDKHAIPVFGFSTSQASRIVGIIQEANTTALQHLEKDTKKIVEIGEEIALLERSIANAPNDDEIGSLISQITKLHSQHGALEAEMNHIEEKISSNIYLKNHLDAKIRDIVSQIYKNEKSKQSVDMTQKVQIVLEEFIEELKIKKIHLLEQYILDAINMLMHKKEFIDKVRVDPDTFEATLFRKNNDPFPKDLLSEGEKQMFAMAILWALAKTSGRPLPFMIDTPLARLDAAHRINIVEKFFPTLSHQILIFSTDKEIEHEYYQKLEPYLARSYAMEYIDYEGVTKKHDGYFWDGEGRKIVAV